MSHRTPPVISKVFAANSYNVAAVSWSAYFSTIVDMGASQIEIHFKAAGEADSTYKKITKSSYSDTYNVTAQAVSLAGATYTSDGSELPFNLDATAHDI